MYRCRSSLRPAVLQCLGAYTYHVASRTAYEVRRDQYGTPQGGPFELDLAIYRRQVGFRASNLSACVRVVVAGYLFEGRCDWFLFWFATSGPLMGEHVTSKRLFSLIPHCRAREIVGGDNSFESAGYSAFSKHSIYLFDTQSS